MVNAPGMNCAEAYSSWADLRDMFLSLVSVAMAQQEQKPISLCPGDMGSVFRAQVKGKELESRKTGSCEVDEAEQEKDLLQVKS